MRERGREVRGEGGMRGRGRDEREGAKERVKERGGRMRDH